MEKLKEKEEKEKKKQPEKTEERGLVTCSGPVGSHTSVSTYSIIDYFLLFFKMMIHCLQLFTVL